MIARIFKEGIVRGFPRKDAKDAETQRKNLQSHIHRARHSRLQFAPGAVDIGTDISPGASGVGRIDVIEIINKRIVGDENITAQ